MIILENGARQFIIAHAIASYPNGCTGYLFGYEDENGRRIVSHAAQEAQGQLLGRYFSHPDQPAVPSAEERTIAEASFSYLIISVNKKEAGAIRVWRLNHDGEFEEENNNLLA